MPSTVRLTPDISIFLALILLLILTFPDIIISPLYQYLLPVLYYLLLLLCPKYYYFPYWWYHICINYLYLYHYHILFLMRQNCPAIYIHTFTFTFKIRYNKFRVCINFLFLTPLRHNVRLPSNLTFFFFNRYISLNANLSIKFCYLCEIIFSNV